MMKYFCYPLLAIALSLPIPAFAQQFHDEWFACQKDDDCVAVAGYCKFEWAINKNYLDQVKKSVSEYNACLKTGTWYPNAKIQCVDNKCQVMPQKAVQ